MFLPPKHHEDSLLKTQNKAYGSCSQASKHRLRDQVKNMKKMMLTQSSYKNLS
ncbi:hypothetical protein Hanom_Chr03g00266031 [Helianthus anomalus]